MQAQGRKKPARGRAPNRPQLLSFSSSGRRDSNPRRPPWQGDFERESPFQRVTRISISTSYRYRALPERSSRYAQVGRKVGRVGDRSGEGPSATWRRWSCEGSIASSAHKCKGRRLLGREIGASLATTRSSAISTAFTAAKRSPLRTSAASRTSAEASDDRRERSHRPPHLGRRLGVAKRCELQDTTRDQGSAKDQIGVNSA
jgi:hypothetical protein